MIKSKSGATSRSKARDYTLLVNESVNAIIDRHQHGIDVGHERENWKLGLDDPEFIRERANHAIEHLMAILTGEHPRDERPALPGDLDGALCNLQMLAWFRVNGTGMQKVFPHLIGESTADPRGGKGARQK